MKKIAVISALLKSPHDKQEKFNSIVSKYAGIVRGRVGVPFAEQNIAAIAIIVECDKAQLDAIASELSEVSDVSVKEA